MAETMKDNQIAAIRTAKEELKTAGRYHKRDLLKHIHRMEKELRDYDRFQRETRLARERSAIAGGQTIHSGGNGERNGTKGRNENKRNETRP